MDRARRSRRTTAARPAGVGGAGTRRRSPTPASRPTAPQPTTPPGGRASAARAPIARRRTGTRAPSGSRTRAPPPSRSRRPSDCAVHGPAGTPCGPGSAAAPATTRATSRCAAAADPSRGRTSQPSAQWLRIVVSARIQSRHCTIVLHTHAQGGEWTHFDDVELVPGRAQLSVFGADVSSLKKSEDLGGVYRDQFGRRGDALRILQAKGMNWIRLRAWVDPADGYHDTAELLQMARRAKATGPAGAGRLSTTRTSGPIPASSGRRPPGRARASRSSSRPSSNYTRGIVKALVAQGTPPAMIQLGNEINPGMLWDYAATWTGCSTADDGLGGTRTECHTENWPQLAELLTAGYHAVKSVSPRTKVMLHLAEGGDNGTFRWWFDNVTTRGVPFDVIGASFYGYWHGSLAQLQFNLERRRDALRQGRRRRGDRLPVHARRRGRRGEHHQPEPAHPRLPGDAARAGGVAARPAGDRARRSRRARARQLLVGGDLDRGPRQRLEPARPELAQRLGEPGALRLRRPAAARHVGVATLGADSRERAMAGARSLARRSRAGRAPS